MRKLLLPLLFVVNSATAQTITFPDNNFRWFLISAGYDTNGDSQIQMTEALAVTNMHIWQQNSNISSIEGIANFSNLQTIIIDNLQVTTVDLTGLPNLKNAGFIDNNALVNINVSAMDNLLTLSISGSPNLVEFELQGLVALKELVLQECPLLEFLDLTPCGALEILNSRNSMTTFDLTGFNNLWSLNVWGEGISSVVLGNCPSLEYIAINAGQIADLDFTQCPAVKDIDLDFSQASPGSAVDASGCVALTHLRMEWTNFEHVNLSGCSSLEYLNAEYSYDVSELNVNGCPALESIFFTGSNLTSVDLSQNPNLDYVALPSSLLSYLNIKNGNAELLIFLSAPTAPLFICADDQDFENEGFQTFLSQNLNTVVANSYCSFTPGGAYNTIAGHVRLDADGDSCSELDLPIPNLNLTVTAGDLSGPVYSHSDGSYTIFVQQASPGITITPQVDNPAYWIISPASQSFNFTTFDFTAVTQDFCITPNGVHPDAEIILVPMGQPQPGFDHHVQIILRNKGNQTLAGNITVQFDDAVIDYLSAGQAPTSVQAGELTFAYSGLQPFQTQSFAITFNINGPMETPPVNLDDVLVFSADATINGTDETPMDNQFTLESIVVGSYDPNDKICLQGSEVSDTQIGEYLHYVINFENTGTAAATNIVVKDVIDQTKYDVSTLQVIETSHPSVTRVTGNTVEFIHENIMLEPEGKGFVVFKIKTLPTLTPGSIASNFADIFFDYNFPITTNLAETTFTSLSTSGYNQVNFSLVPNPATSVFAVQSNSEIKSVSVFDAQGRLIKVQKEVSVDVSQLQRGIYMVRVVTAEGVGTQKLVKE